MRIRKLELHGFKSFPDRTTLHFGSGIAVVVGPNGCGKSNIVDAIKWCIGEQSAKSLRGEEMQDVIFGGSTERSKVGFAEVALTFTAEGGDPLPGEYARFTEISVGRRLHRDGTSEYAIQGQKVRRKDIVDLFLDTGVGSNLYSFIEQGRIGEIVHASPEKRRLLVDEAAGISRYKARRDEAQQRLEDTAGQLDRAADVTDEMGRRLALLEAQVIRAARFRRARGLVRQLEIYLALARYADQLEARRADQHELQRARDDADALEREVQRRESDIQQRQAELDVLEAGVVVARDEVAELDAALREKEGAKGYTERSRGEIDDEIGRHRKLLAEAEADHAKAASEAASQEASGEGIAADVGVAEARLVEQRRQHEAALSRRQAARDALAGAEKDLAAVVAELAGLRARQEELARRVAAIPATRERLGQALDGARREHASLAQKSAKARLALDSRRRALEVAKDAVAGAEKEVAAFTAEETAARGELERVEADVLQRRKAAEAEVQRALEGVARAERRAREGLAEAERRSAERVRAAQASSEAAIEAEQARAKQAARLADERARAWTAALTAEVTRAADARIAALEAADRTIADEEARAAADEERRWNAEADAKEAAVRDDARRAIEAATAVRDDAAAAAEVAQKTRADADSRVASLARERDELAGRRRGLLARAEAERDGERGAVAVRSALADARPLVERRPITDDEAWIPRAMGSRLLVPATASVADLRRAADAARGAGPASVLWISSADPLARLVESVRVADSFDDAVRSWEERGGSVVVRGTGERIDPDGWVHLAPGAAAEEAAKRQREIVSIEARASEVAALLQDAEAERAAAAAAMASAREAAATAEKTLRSEESAARDRVRIAVEAARAAARTAIGAAATARKQRDDARRAAREPGIAELRRAVAARVAEAAAAAQEALRQVRDELDAGIERIRSAGAGTVDAERTAAADAVAEARRSGEAGIVEARSTVDALRAAASRDDEAGRQRAGTARAALDAARGRRQEAEGVYNRVRNEQFAAEVALARAEGDVGTLAATDERLRGRMGELEGQLSAVQKDEEHLAAAAAALEADRAARESARTVAEERRGQCSAERARAESDEESSRSAVADSDVLLAGLRERGRAARLAAEKGRATAAEAVTRAARLRLRLDELADARSGTFDAEAALTSEIAALSARREAAAERLGRDRERTASNRKNLKDLDAAWRERLARREAVARTVGEVETRLAGVVADIETIRSRIDERYQVSLSGALDRLDAMRAYVLDPDATIREAVEVGGQRVPGVDPITLRPEHLTDEARIADAVARLEALREELGQIGEVNLAAFEEYRELAARFGDLSAQRADLEASVESIRGAIAKMNRTCRERFRDAFDRVNENFQRAYPRLVGGGSARLSLTDEEDLLETGVDIFVQPPGKRLQNLTLLSGGEKAMAAIALLLSLFQVKPSPFCLLDEVDAPLDEANGARFNDMLREMAEVTQFIVITHNRKTMEAADTLYGITMPTPGVSRLVSVRLSGDAETAAGR